MSALLLFHVGCAALGLCAGTAALSLRKAGRGHRLSGNIFLGAMFGMGLSAAQLALAQGQTLNCLVGLVTCYLVVTGWLTAKRRIANTVPADWIAMEMGAIMAGALFYYGSLAMHSPDGLWNGEAADGYFTFGTVTAIGVGLDLRMLFWNVEGVHRILRHLWRMLFAMLIAVVSVSARFPKIFGHLPHILTWQLMPIGAMVLALLYWLLRVAFGKAYKLSRVARSTP